MLIVSIADGEFKIVCIRSGLEVQEVEAGWSMADPAPGETPDNKRFLLKHIDDGQYTVIGKNTGNTLVLKASSQPLRSTMTCVGRMEKWQLSSSKIQRV
jgi:hypothetical protein